jgi:hypothetical protein
MLQLLVIANFLSSLIIFNLKMEPIRSFESSVLTRATRRYISQDGILYSDRLENLKSYIVSFYILFFVNLSSRLEMSLQTFIFLHH